ncbi:angiotensin-converting enzyme-like [Ctenocephalides felis]|uniref:angiotensin-converting enzyme-like n=1 Tax=Ctenocephalides felis TaxID=7515 RepID=UPI000E6E3B1A|nr:angiotensin-converting enzyme-like [Ctenocephalides felis]
MWKNGVCSKADEFDPSAFSTMDYRQLYLLCRGAKYTSYQASQLSNLLEQLQTIYVTSQVCIPKRFSLDRIYDETIIRTAYSARMMMVPRDNSEELDESLASYGYDMDYIDPQGGSSQLDFNNYLCFNGEPDLQRLMTGKYWPMIYSGHLTVDQEERLLRWAWEAWRFAVGPPIRTKYPEFVKILNIGAHNNGYSDVGQIVRIELEMDNLKEVTFNLLNDIMPFYKMLHAFVRHALHRKYDMPFSRYIPAHLLGNMWSQNWEYLQDILIENTVDLDKAIRDNKWTVLDMVNRAEDFYISLGLEKMTENFWKYSVFQKQNNWTKCHGTAANMFEKDDYRILLCASESLEDFLVIHHEMGHIQYYMEYKDQPPLFQDGTNSAFHESIGDAIMLGVMTPQHLHRLGLIDDSTLYDNTSLPKLSFDLVLLLKQALSKIPQIPFGYIIDTYRWAFFEGKLNNSNYNKYFWYLTKEIQGIEAPSQRNEEYFDIASKFHVPDNTPYIRYFLSSFLQAQIFKGLCSTTVFGRPTHNKLPMPLHRCDIYGSKKAGKKLREMLSLGSSVHWSEALNMVAKTNKLSAQPLLEYFDPIIKWLKIYLHDNNIPLDW